MVKTIGNPLTWAAGGLAGTAEHLAHSVESLGGAEAITPQVRRLTTQDIRDALRLGYADFAAARADVMFICLVYPAIGVLLAAVGFNASVLPVVFPVAAGFALMGPLAAVGLYEVSRQRERGRDVSWLTALSVIRAPNFGAIMVLGLYLAALFVAWIVSAHAIWLITLGPEQPASVSAFLAEVFTTAAGWAMIVVGMAVGFCFALLVLVTSVVSFPLLLDRNVGVPVAVMTSCRVARENPRVIATWGLVVAAFLVLGSIPAFIGLVIALPVLGHATWHLYRRAVKV